MNLPQLLDWIRDSAPFKGEFVAWHKLPEVEAQWADFPASIPEALRTVLHKRGINQLYTHQSEAIDRVLAGEDVVIVTPTASGKTLCYNLPILSTWLSEPEARALYLFPTKALAQDQLAELHGLTTEANFDLKTYTFDGDTPSAARRAIRSAGHIVITNPDMLHAGILPHHTVWTKLFENLRYVVIDEMHGYRGVFGSHFANLMRRLHRICEFYHAHPQFILCSATIRNPKNLAEKLIGRGVTLIDNNGAPRAEKHILVYNPPVVNKELGIRKSAGSETVAIAKAFIINGVQTIVFARTRLSVELILTTLRDALVKLRKNPNWVQGYRGGYLPNERRNIERGLRDGEILGVVSTNALELGIDIGQLEVAVLNGYPGMIASFWQQSGRAGRRQGLSLVVLVCSSAPLDQYIAGQPEYLLGSPTEEALVDPDNLYILTSHIKCAGFELPFDDAETFGIDSLPSILGYFEEAGILHHKDGRWYWNQESYPAEAVSLRSAAAENFVIIDWTDKANHRVIGQMDLFDAPVYLHEDAVYIHQGKQHFVDKMEWDARRVFVKRVDLNYYTQALTKVDVRILDILEERPAPQGTLAHGEISVTLLATAFKKLKMDTRENVGFGEIHLPEQEMHTTSLIIEFDDQRMANAGFNQETLAYGLRAASNLLAGVVPLYISSDPNDIRAYPEVRSPYVETSAIYIYDNYPGGIGYAAKLYRVFEDLCETAILRARDCVCKEGCPSCAGPPLEIGPFGKTLGLRVLRLALGRVERM